VLQAGGDEGMWTFDRYQRWMEQVTDWVHPPSTAALRTQGDAGAPRPAAPLRGSLGVPPVKPETTARAASAVRPATAAVRPATAAARPAPGMAGSSLGKPASGEEVIEVPAEDLDLAQLAELAKKVIERKP
jgi:hypothetical protein